MVRSNFFPFTAGQMAITIDASYVNSIDEITCHLLPCTISKDGEANVAKFFETMIREENNEMTTSFRGRPLNGRRVILPTGYTGVILRERGSAVTEDQARELQVDRKFSTFIAWNLDKPCSDDDKLHKALQWINIAKALHRPVDEESSQQRASQ